MRPGRHIGPALLTPVALGVAMIVLYTILISSADAITKLFAENFGAAQLFAFSGFLVALLCLAADRIGPARRGMRTGCPRAMAVRVGATIGATLAFYHAFRLLPFAEVFLFIALIPLIAGLLSGPVLGEPLRPPVWAALTLGFLGVVCLFPGGIAAITTGHLVALVAAILGTVSMVASRYISRRDDNLLAQVFYPNLALSLVMGAALPFVYRPMGLGDLGWALSYAVLLFSARWVLVATLRLLPAYVVTPLMNLQFLWMVLIGLVVFGETPGAEVYLGAAIMVLAGGWLIYDQTGLMRALRKPRIMPAE